jgi:hypothetical protein
VDVGDGVAVGDAVADGVVEGAGVPEAPAAETVTLSDATSDAADDGGFGFSAET